MIFLLYLCYFVLKNVLMLCWQEIQDLNELISEIGGELGKIAEEEKWQTLNDIKELEVLITSSDIDWIRSCCLLTVH